MARFIKSMGLIGSEKRFFECLVALEETDGEIGLKDRALAAIEIRKIQLQWSRKILSPSEEVKKVAAQDWAFKMTHVAEVYAALGDSEKGASIQDILIRTQLSLGVCEKTLQFLVHKNAVSFKNKKYFTCEMSLDIFGLAENPKCLKKHVDFWFSEHNDRIPHTAFNGETPAEKFKQTWDMEREIRILVKQEDPIKLRIKHNQHVFCKICEVA